jgi:hypothetical protein
MAKSVAVTLDGTTYTVKAFTLDDLEEVAGILGDGTQVTGATSVKVLKIALRNADPPITKAGSIRIDSLEELNKATTAILELAGLKVGNTANPTEAVPAA